MKHPKRFPEGDACKNVGFIKTSDERKREDIVNVEIIKIVRHYWLVIWLARIVEYIIGFNYPWLLGSFPCLPQPERISMYTFSLLLVFVVPSFVGNALW